MFVLKLYLTNKKCFYADGKSCFLLHFRPISEGGQYEGDENKRQDALRLAMELGANYIDVELKVLHCQ